jgi:hypothetical protein
MVRDYESARDPLMSLFGQRILEDTWIENPHIARRGGMTWIGDNSLELGQPIIPGTGTDKFVERHGPGMHSIALQVQDMTSTCEHARRMGVRIVEVSDTVSFCHPKDTGGVFIEWFTGEPDFDPRFGAPMPHAGNPAVAVEHMAFAGAVVEDPVELAAMLAELFGTEVTFAVDDALPGMPVTGVSLVDNMLALYAMPGRDSDELWGTDHREPRVHVLALSVGDLAEAEHTLRSRDVGVVRSDAHTVVVAPAATGQVPVLLTDELLTGDPRRAR